MTKTASGFLVLMKENVSRFEFKNFKVNTHTKKTIYKLLYIILKSHGMKQNDGLFVREESSRKERSREYQNNQHTSTSCKRRGAVASALHRAFKTRQTWGCNCSLPKINSNMRASAYATHVEQILEK